MSAEGDDLALKQTQTKLEIVRQEVRQNPKVYFAGEFPDIHMSGWAQGIGIIVAPRSPLFDADALNEFMSGLVKGVEPTDAIRFEDLTLLLRLGRLMFDENIGLIEKEITSKVTIFDLEAMQATGVELNPKNPQRETEILRRRTNLMVYPDIISAVTMYNYRAGVADLTAMSTSQMDKFQWDIERPYLERLKDQYRRKSRGSQHLNLGNRLLLGS